MTDKVAELLEDEWYIVRNSGETPEIALHSALYYLTVSKDGPRIELSAEQFATLQRAAVERFYEIIVRDLQHVNHGTPGYRGITRSIVNYRRYRTFCERQRIDPSILQEDISAALLNFLETEAAQAGQRPSIIDCTGEALRCFAADLGIDLDCRFAGLCQHCVDAE